MHVLSLIDQHDRACLEVHVPSDKLREAAELFQRLYPQGRLSIDGHIVALGGPPASVAGGTPHGAVAAVPSAPAQGFDLTVAHTTAAAQINTMLFKEHMDCQRSLTEDMIQQYRRVRASIEEVDLMTRGARVIEFQEMIRSLQAMSASPQRGTPDERGAWRQAEFERFFIGGLKATKIL